jgi:polyhydroxyalkanoate synthase subunit PhaC
MDDERWTLDEFPMPGGLFAEVIEALYRQDRFARGTLYVGDRLAAPANIGAPMLVVFNPHSRIVPPESMARFINALPAHADAKALQYEEGDAGVALQHVGVRGGRKAHCRLWLVIRNWLRQRFQRPTKT